MYSVELPKLVESPTVSNVTCTSLDVVWTSWSASSDIGSETIIVASYTSVYDVTSPRCTLQGHFTFLLSISLRLTLSPKFGLRPKISQKVKSFFFVRTQRIAQGLARSAEPKRRTERSLNQKLINSSVDLACIR